MASAAQVTTLGNADSGPALLIQSEPLIFDIVDDPAWSHAAAETYDRAYERLCRTNDLRDARQLQCFDIAERIANLDTVESLATEIKYLDGRQHSWDNQFWAAILATSHQADGLRLLSERMQDADFQVSAEIVQLLAIWDLKRKDSEAFSGDDPALYHEPAVASFRKYVRLLGRSLWRKNADVLVPSALTYHQLANQNQCGSEPFISRGEQEQTLSAAGLKWNSSRNNVEDVANPDRHP